MQLYKKVIKPFCRGLISIQNFNSAFQHWWRFCLERGRRRHLQTLSDSAEDGENFQPCMCVWYIRRKGWSTNGGMDLRHTIRMTYIPSTDIFYWSFFDIILAPVSVNNSLFVLFVHNKRSTSPGRTQILMLLIFSIWLSFLTDAWTIYCVAWHLQTGSINMASGVNSSILVDIMIF